VREIIRKLIFVFIIFLSGLSLSPPANGKVEIDISPHFNMEVTYTDNIGFTADTSSDFSQGDFYALVVPGVALGIPNRLLDFKADYSYYYYRYAKYSSKNRGYHDVDLEVGRTLAIFKNVNLEFGDKYEFVPVNINLPEDLPDNQAQRNRFYLRPSWIKSLNRRNQLEARYEFDRVDYTGSGRTNGQNYSAHYFHGGWENVTTRWFHFSLNGGYQITDYDTLPTYTQFTPEAGISVAIVKNLTFVSRVGYFLENVNFDQEGNLAYFFSAAYNRAEKLKVKAAFKRERNLDIEGRLFTEDRYELSYFYRPRKKLGFDGYIRYNEYLHPDEKIKMFEARFAVIYYLSRKIDLRGGYVYNKRFKTFSEEEASSNRFYLGIAVVL